MKEDAKATQRRKLDYRSGSEDRSPRRTHAATRIIAAIFGLLFGAAAVYFSFAPMDARRGHDPHPVEVIAVAALGSLLCFLIAVNFFRSGIK